MFTRIKPKHLLLAAGILASIFIVRDLYYVLWKGYTYNQNVINQVIGFLVGVATNFVVWWFLLYGLSPEIKFSEVISKLKIKNSDPSKPKYSYRCKFINSGRRDVIDVEIMARLTLKGIGRFPKNWKHYYIPLSSDGEKSFRIPRMSPGYGYTRVMHLKINNAQWFKTDTFFPKEFREKATQKTLALEDLFALDPSAYISIHVFCYDGFSGSRRLFTSKRYMVVDIQEGYFDRQGLGVIQKKAGTKPLVEISEEGTEHSKDDEEIEDHDGEAQI